MPENYNPEAMRRYAERMLESTDMFEWVEYLRKGRVTWMLMDRDTGQVMLSNDMTEAQAWAFFMPIVSYMGTMNLAGCLLQLTHLSPIEAFAEIVCAGFEEAGTSSVDTCAKCDSERMRLYGSHMERVPCECGKRSGLLQADINLIREDRADSIPEVGPPNELLCNPTDRFPGSRNMIDDQIRNH